METGSTATRRIQSVDLIKVIAMIGVIGLHTTHDFILGEAGWLARWLYESCVVAVPLFFVVSGYLLLGRDGVDWRYALRKVWGIVRYVALMSCLWLVALALRDVLRHGCGTGYMRLFLPTFGGAFVQQGPLWMFWFLGSMAIIYVLLPVIRRIFRHPRLAVGVFALLFVVEAVVLALNLHGAVATGIPFEGHIVQTLRLWNWLFYFMLGGMLRRYAGFCPSRGILAVALAGLLVLSLIVIGWLASVMHMLLCELFYCLLPVMLLVAATAAFVLRLGLHDCKLLKWASLLFLPVYTLHPFVIAVLAPHVHYGAFGVAAPLAHWCLISVATIALSAALMRIPVMRRLFSL